MSIVSPEAELQLALTRYLGTYLVRRDRAGMAALFSPTAFLVGTAVDEVAYDRADLQRLADRDFAQVPDPIAYRITASKVSILSERFAQTLAELDLELRNAGQAVPVPHFRLTFLWRRARQARDDFLDRIAHQYRTPLAIIKTQLKLLGLQPGAATLAKPLDRLGTSAARLEGLFDQALRPGDEGGETRCQRLDLSAFLATASEQVRQSRLALAATACHLTGPGEGHWWVAADPLLLTTILDNLLDNACNYGLPPGPIQLSLSRPSRRAPAVRLVIRNRCALPVATHPATLLERGVRGANSAGCPGHGLGLNLASHLARDLGGELQVHLTPDAYFEAWLDLPAWPEPGSAMP